MGEPSSRRRSGELGLLLAAGMGRGLEPGAAGGGSRGSRKCSQGLCSSSGPGPGASRADSTLTRWDAWCLVTDYLLGKKSI